MPKIKIRYFEYQQSLGQFGSLESAFRHALAKTVNGTAVDADWSLREWKGEKTEPRRDLLANHINPQGGTVFGNLLAFRPGTIDMYLDRTQPGGSEGKTAQLHINSGSIVKGSLYWLIKDNHVLTAAHLDLSVSGFQRYLTWFLEAYASLNIADGIKLASFVPTATSDLHDIQGITIGQELIAQPGKKYEDREKRRGDGEQKVGESTDTGLLRKVLAAFFDAPEKASAVIDRLDTDETLSWSIVLKQPRVSKEKMKAALNEAAMLVTDSDEDIKFSLATSKGTIKGDMLLLSETADLPNNRDGVPDRNILRSVMVSVLQEWISQKRVNP